MKMHILLRNLIIVFLDCRCLNARVLLAGGNASLGQLSLRGGPGLRLETGRALLPRDRSDLRTARPVGAPAGTGD